MFVEGTITTRRFALISLYGTQLQGSLFSNIHFLSKSKALTELNSSQTTVCSCKLLQCAPSNDTVRTQRHTDQTRRGLFLLNCKNKHASKNSGLAKHSGSSRGLIRLTWQKESVFVKRGGVHIFLTTKQWTSLKPAWLCAHESLTWLFVQHTDTHTFCSYSVTGFFSLTSCSQEH